MKKIRDMKALARQSLLGKYGTVIGAYFLSGALIGLSALLAVFSIVAAFANTGRFEPVAQKVIPSFKAVPALSVVFAVLFTAFILFTVILTIWLRFGREKLLLNICRGEKYGCSDIFYAFKGGTHPWRVVVVRLLGSFFIEVNYLIPAILMWAAKVSGYDRKNPDTQSPWFIAIIIVNVLVAIWTIWLSIGFTFSETVIIDRPDTGVFEALKASLNVTKFKKLKLFWMVTFSFIFWYFAVWLVKIASLWVLPYVETTVIIFYLCARGEEFVIPANKPKADAPEEASEAEPSADEPAKKESEDAEPTKEEVSAAPVNEPVPDSFEEAPETGEEQKEAFETFSEGGVLREGPQGEEEILISDYEEAPESAAPMETEVPLEVVEPVAIGDAAAPVNEPDTEDAVPVDEPVPVSLEEAAEEIIITEDEV